MQTDMLSNHGFIRAHTLTSSPIHSLTHSASHSLTHSLTHPPAHSRTHPPTRSLTQFTPSLTTTSRVVIAVSKAESATSQLVGQVVEHEHFLTQINGGLFFSTVRSLFKILTRCGCLGRDAFRASVGANFCRFGIRDSFGLQFFARVRLRTSAGVAPYIAVFF